MAPGQGLTLLMLDFSSIKLCTFDCYGTLIDWESGLLSGVRPVLESHGAVPSDSDIIDVFAREERVIERGAYMRYRDVCAENMRRIARQFRVELDIGEEHALAESIKDWPVFDDTVAGLWALQARYKLAVLSNIDDDLFAQTAPKLNVELDELVTAQQVGSYKPGLAHFETVLGRTGLESNEILHVAESRFHDIAPASVLGFKTVWVHRRADRSVSASGASEAEADLTVGSLRELVGRIGC